VPSIIGTLPRSWTRPSRRSLSGPHADVPSGAGRGVCPLSGLTKLHDREAAEQALRDFGTPARLVRPAARALPIVELLGAIGVLLPVTAPWAAGVLLVLLVGFSAAIGLSLWRGRRPPCHCFGQLSTTPIGWPTLVRNGVLAGLALLVVRSPDTGWVGSVFAAIDIPLARAGADPVTTAGAAVASLALILVVGLLHQNAQLASRLAAIEASGGVPGVPPPDGLPVGTMAPDFALPEVLAPLAVDQAAVRRS
jgi:hypothetical protein